MKKSIYYCSLVVLLLVSCSSEDEYSYDYFGDEKGYHILILGDSFSRDAFSYVPSIMEDIYPGLIVDMEILCLNGKALNYHWDYLRNNKSEFVMDFYTTKYGRWNTLSGISGERVISSKKWDLVILQEGSVTIRNYTKTRSHVDSISNYIKLKHDKVKFAFMLSPSKPDGSSALGKNTSDEVWKENANTSFNLLKQNAIDYIIPCGTAIQNARYTYLDNIGDFGHLSYDGNHLQEGLPCLIEAYVASQSIFNILSVNAFITGSNLRVSQQWVYNKNIPGQHGYVISGTDEDYELCKQCALLAIENPYEISINQ